MTEFIDFEPTIEPSEVNSDDLSGRVCIDGVADTVKHFLSDKGRVAKATTPLEPDQSQSDPYSLLKAREAMGSPTGAEGFHFRNTHGQ